MTSWTSWDGQIHWMSEPIPMPNRDWLSIAYGDGLLVAVGAGNNDTWLTLISKDGINWTFHEATSNRNWTGVAFSPSMSRFVAVASDGSEEQRAMTFIWRKVGLT